MIGKYTILALFCATSLATLYLILRRPVLHLRIRNRALEIPSYFLGALLGPLFILAFGALSYGEVLGGLSGAGRVNPFGILVLFLSMVFISIYLDITGFFEYCARIALQRAGGDGVRLFLSLYVMVSLLTIFTSNDIIVLTFTPFIYYFARDAGINPKPYLIAEFFAANTWSMMLYIGNPTNILLASAFGLPFDAYVRWMFLPTVTAGVTGFAALYLLFRHEIRRPLPARYCVDTAGAITDPGGAFAGLFLLGGCIIALALAPYAHIDLWIVALAFALALILLLVIRDSVLVLKERALLRKRAWSVRTTAGRMPWTVVPFVLSLFITVEALQVYGVTGEIGRALASLAPGSVAARTFLYGTLSAVAANFMNNIPMTVAFVPILGEVSGTGLLAAVLATTIGSNLGANLTPLGSLAGIMWMSLLRDKDVQIGFREFMLYGLAITPLTIAAALGVLALEFILV